MADEIDIGNDGSSAQLTKGIRNTSEDVWLIFYEDHDVRPEIFTGQGAERAAKYHFHQQLINWGCHLFKLAVPAAPSPTETPTSSADGMDIAGIGEHARLTRDTNTLRGYVEVLSMRLTEAEAWRMEAVNSFLGGETEARKLRHRVAELEAQLSDVQNKTIEECAQWHHIRAVVNTVVANDTNEGMLVRTNCRVWASEHLKMAEAFRALKSQEIKPFVRDDAWLLRLIATAYDEGQNGVMCPQYGDAEYTPCEPMEILTAFLDGERHQGEEK